MLRINGMIGDLTFLKFIVVALCPSLSFSSNGFLSAKPKYWP